MTTNDKEAREAFEREWNRLTPGDPDSNTYGCSHQEAGWLMWQAARRTQQDGDVVELVRQLREALNSCYTGPDSQSFDPEAINEAVALADDYLAKQGA